MREEGETGWTQTFGNDGHTVDPTSGDDSTGNDFANFEDISISGTNRRWPRLSMVRSVTRMTRRNR